MADTKAKFNIADFEGDDVSVPRGLGAHVHGSVRGFAKRTFTNDAGQERAWIVAVVDTETGPVEIGCDAPFVDREQYGLRLDLSVDITPPTKANGDLRVRYISHRALDGAGTLTAITTANGSRTAVTAGG